MIIKLKISHLAFAVVYAVSRAVHCFPGAAMTRPLVSLMHSAFGLLPAVSGRGTADSWRSVCAAGADAGADLATAARRAVSRAVSAVGGARPLFVRCRNRRHQALEAHLDTGECLSGCLHRHRATGALRAAGSRRPALPKRRRGRPNVRARGSRRPALPKRRRGRPNVRARGSSRTPAEFLSSRLRLGFCCHSSSRLGKSV